MNYRIAKKILFCKSSLHNNLEKVMEAREELRKHPERMKRDSIFLVPFTHKDKPTQVNH